LNFESKVGKINHGTVDKKQTRIGNCKYATASRKLMDGRNIVEMVGATSSEEGFLVQMVISGIVFICYRLPIKSKKRCNSLLN